MTRQLGDEPDDEELDYAQEQVVEAELEPLRSIWSVIREQPRQVLQGSWLAFYNTAAYFTIFVFIPASWLHQTMKQSTTTAVCASDRVERRLDANDPVLGVCLRP